MVDILHRIGIKNASPEAVYNALTTVDGLAAWWTGDVKGQSSIGDHLTFRFGEKGFFEMEIVDLASFDKVKWLVKDGPEEWVGTFIEFNITQKDDFMVVLFKHEGWREPVEFMHHCSTKWAIFLMSLKSYLETGSGSPCPNDIKIDNWN